MGVISKKKEVWKIYPAEYVPFSATDWLKTKGIGRVMGEEIYTRELHSLAIFHKQNETLNNLTTLGSGAPSYIFHNQRNTLNNIYVYAFSGFYLRVSGGFMLMTR